ncbi:MAG: nitrate reductase [Alphaproteobacteria bacterium]|nr:MAG: nitrate reductase [Alphaproteobacteria bacterium]
MALNRPTLDRRAFISGRMANPDALVMPPDTEIASVLVQARPDRLAQVEAAIAALPGCEVHARDPKGKLVVVIETPSAGAVGSTLNTIALLPDVFSAALVFHAIDVAASGETS